MCDIRYNNIFVAASAIGGRGGDNNRWTAVVIPISSHCTVCGEESEREKGGIEGAR